MYRVAASATLLLLAASLHAAAPRTWTSATLDDFLAGESDRIGVTANGSLIVAPSTTKLGSIDDPFVLSQTVDPAGNRYVGTGNEGRVYRLAPGGILTEVFRAAEPEIYALSWFNGALYAAASPWGGVYRIDPSDGSSKLVWKPEAAYVWALTVGGDTLYAATGLEGGIHAISRSGESRRIWSAPESHVRALSVTSDGSLIAGGSGEGRIYRVTRTGQAYSLFDSSLSEITAVVATPDGGAWAAGSAGLLPAQAPQRSDSRQQQSQSSESQSSSEQGSVSVDISFGETPTGTPTPPQLTGSSELYRVHPDGYVETVRKFEREIIYALESDGMNVVIGTGPQAKIYRVDDSMITLLATVPEKQIVSIQKERAAFVVTTSNSGAVYSVGAVPAERGTWTSPVRDAGMFARWGAWKLLGRGLDGPATRVEFRSGNSATPDATWSDWSGVDGSSGQVTAPAARYLQYRVQLASSPNARVDRLNVSYLQRNVRPVIDNVTVQEPGVVYVSGAYAQAPQVLEATNPDEYGIFTSLDTPRDRNEQGKKMFRRGYRTLSWIARDENGDTLTYDVSFRPSGNSDWMRLRDSMRETQMNFDSSQLPDGTYEVRVTASDRVDNPENAMTVSRGAVFFDVDNTAPAIEVRRSGGVLDIIVTDAASAVIKTEVSFGADEWKRIQPVDGIGDSTTEKYRVDVRAEDRFIIIRTVDAQYNVATASAPSP